MSKFLVFVLLAIFSHFFVQVPFFALLLLTVICYLVFFLVSPKKAVLIFLFFLISQGVLTYFTRMPIVANLDELGIFCITFLLLARKLYKREKILTGGIEIPLLFLTILGFLSNIINRIVPWPVAVGGYILFIKGFLLFYILLNLGINTEDLKKFKPMFYLLGVFTFLYGVLGLIWPKFFLIPLGIMPDTRFGFPTMQSFMGHPGAFAALMGILYCFSFTDALYKKRPIYILLTLIFFLAVILSFRRTTLAGIILASFVILSSATIRQQAGIKIVRKMSMMILAIIVIFSGIIFILYQEMQSSYLSKESPRGILLKTGIKVAKDFFPLGSGFGTYSSGINQRFYSPLFYKYRLHRVWGLSEEKRSFTNDTFWPHVLAETGIFGLLSYFSIIVIFLVKCFKGLRDFKNERVMWIATLSLLLLVLSLVEVTKATFYEMSLWTFFYFGSIGVLTAWFQSLN